MAGRAENRKTDPRVTRYRSGGGRDRGQQREAVVDVFEPKIPIRRGLLSSAEFVEETVKELKIRCYSKSSIKTYRSHLVAFLRWAGEHPNRVSRQNVRNDLLFLADTGFSASKLSGALSAIRTAFDDFFCRQVTAGLVTPKNGKKLPITLSGEEVRRMIDACCRLRDKMLVSLLYATGVRVSEVAKMRWSDFDFERNIVLVSQGKGAKDRQVTMPESFRGLLSILANQIDPQDYIFPSEDSRKGPATIATCLITGWPAVLIDAATCWQRICDAQS